MDQLFPVIIVLIAAVVVGYIAHRKIRDARGKIGMIVDLGREMHARGTTMAGLIEQNSDPVRAIIHPHMALTALAALVLDSGGIPGPRLQAALRDAVMAQFRTGEDQAESMVILSQWVIQEVARQSDGPLRLALHAREMAGQSAADDLQILVTSATAPSGLNTSQAEALARAQNEMAA